MEQNMLNWVYEQTKLADKIIIFHSTTTVPRCGVYDVVNNFFPSTDPRLVHVALGLDAQRDLPREIEFVMPRDQRHLEEAFDISITDPLVIDIPQDVVIVPGHHNSNDSIVEVALPNNSKTHSTDSGVSSMSSNSSQSGKGAQGVAEAVQTNLEEEIPMVELTAESDSLLYETTKLP